MTATLIQMVVTTLWGLILASHIRRLARLAHIVGARNTWAPYVRRYAHRVRWWLGREEFWHRVQFDTCRCLEITLLVFLLASRM